MSELKALTGARGIAAWLVVFFHLRHSLVGVPAPVMAVLDKGYLAVDFFFLLSGFVIALAWGPRFAAEGWRAVLPFLRKRFARVVPLHWFVLAGTVVLAAAMGLSGREVGDQFPWGALPLHVVLVQSWGTGHALAWNDPAWSISAEFAAYLLFPVAAVSVDWRRRSTGLALLAIAVATLAVALLLASRGEHGMNGDVGQYGVARCIGEFTSGTIVAALYLRWHAVPGVAVGAALIGLTMLGGFAAGWLNELLAAPVGFAALLLALALTAGRAGNMLEGRWVHWLGEVSYATYLAHYPMWFVFKLLFVTDAAAAPWGVVMAYFGAVVVASGLLYRFVERPAQRWVNGLGRVPVRRAVRG
ncbi:hypothetical protein ASG37_00680 [Sphingomonas sp. Leaf407]|uniref:acyltransferase family protein n=1 Tax=unclassified Sphingomonas TaxID=196159 RepID=UPI00070080FA|nr:MULTISPECIES: acyltransferase [unclassified Sphingomonas]KQN40914.1 hypothetical protein ASE97_00710 [Sphingomonas sp. Leaf42]KQT30715.1 hypothetical protein ASG37_00680 [Sphingomonas sp. Leaf407]